MGVLHHPKNASCRRKQDRSLPFRAEVLHTNPPTNIANRGCREAFSCTRSASEQLGMNLSKWSRIQFPELGHHLL